MNLIQALILSIIEGITEFLPVSSTGHLILASHLMGISETEFVKSFEIIIQLGAILAVLVLYGRRVRRDFECWKRVIVAFIPTGIIGLVLYKIIKSYLLGNTSIVIWSLLIGGIVMILLEKYFAKKEVEHDAIHKMSWLHSAIIGVVQSISVIPGVSRSAASIFAGLGVGLDRKSAVEFSFLLAVPTMAAAAGLDLFKTRLLFNSDQYFLIAVGFVGAFVTALFSIKVFLKYVERHSFTVFGIYRIVLAVVFLLLVR